MPVRSLTEALPAAWTRGEIAVIGLARSGRAAAELLARAGASVYASEGGSGDAVQHAARVLGPLGVAVQQGGHDLARIAASAVVVASPGVPPDAPPLAAAREAGRTVVSELEIALEFLPHQRYVAITGTNGKTTTTAITHRLLEGLGYDAVAAGNIGTPLAEVALRVPLIARAELALLGDHNVANALAAALAVMGADESHRTEKARGRIADALRSFRALEHRIEPAGTFGGVDWINDSKSTNVASTLVALRGMRKRTVLLLGGRHKGEPYTALGDELRRIGRAVIAYGESAAIVEGDLGGVVPVERLGASFDSV